MSTRAAVVTCSDTAAVDPTVDTTGPMLAGLLRESGFDTDHPTVVPDDLPRIAGAVRTAVVSGCRVVALTGGTGLGPRDVTPEALGSLGARPVPGIGEAMRAAARQRIPTTDLSRAGAWTWDGAVLLALPGSPGGVRDGWAVAAPLVGHALDMLAGGGHPRTVEPPDAWVSPRRIDPAALSRAAGHDAAGATVVFEGRVRDHDHGRPVTALHYEGHPDADGVLRSVVAEAAALPEVRGVAARHRVGDLAIGEVAFCVAVSAAHRGEAFAACSWLVDAAKERLPIWKHQVFADGTSEWVNCP